MSIITVTIKQPISSSVIFKLYKLLALSVSDVKNRVVSGVPIFDDELFDNGYEEKSTILRKLIKITEDESINIDIIESPERDCDPKYKMMINKEILRNILDSADSEISRF